MCWGDAGQVGVHGWQGNSTHARVGTRFAVFFGCGHLWGPGCPQGARKVLTKQASGVRAGPPRLLYFSVAGTSGHLWVPGCPQDARKGSCEHPHGHPICCKCSVAGTCGHLWEPGCPRMPAVCPRRELRASLWAPACCKGSVASTCGHLRARGCPKWSFDGGHLRAPVGTWMPTECPQRELQTPFAGTRIAVFVRLWAPAGTCG